MKLVSDIITVEGYIQNSIFQTGIWSNGSDLFSNTVAEPHPTGLDPYYAGIAEIIIIFENLVTKPLDGYGKLLIT